VKFLVDSQPPTALARFLSSHGIECQHVLDIDLDGATDTSIWEYASRNDCVFISKDEDFLYMSNVPSAKARLIWVRFGNCRTKALLAAMERLSPKIEAGLKAGDRVIEFRCSKKLGQEEFTHGFRARLRALPIPPHTPPARFGGPTRARITAGFPPRS
jgi:predicted nuclease of predicted toxin-antitoxin system